MTTGKSFEFTGHIFVDSTGYGYLAYKLGADYRVGREGKDEFGEKHAPEKLDDKTLCNTVMFKE